MNNPDTTHALPEPTNDLPVAASTAEPVRLPSASTRARRARHEEYSDSANGIPQADRNRFEHDASLPLEVAASRLGASIFACGLLPAVLWATGCLGGVATLAFAAASAVGAVRLLLGEQSLGTAGFVGFQMLFSAIAVTLTFGFFIGLGFGFIGVPASLLGTATVFARFRRPAPAAGSGRAKSAAATAMRSNPRPALRVVSGHSRPHSA